MTFRLRQILCKAFLRYVFLQGYGKKDSIIITQVPTTNTMDDFWDMIWSVRCVSIVMLNAIDYGDEVRRS